MYMYICMYIFVPANHPVEQRHRRHNIIVVYHSERKEYSNNDKGRYIFFIYIFHLIAERFEAA